MSNLLEEALFERLRQGKSGVTDTTEFQSVCHRLLANQVLYAEHNNVERDLYLIFKQFEDAIAEYFSLINFTVFHDVKAGYVILFAPGFNSPSTPHTDDPVFSGLKRKLSVDAILLLLVLRQAYEDILRSGKGFDESGCASVAVQKINTLYGTLLGRKAPSSLERKDVFMEIKSLRLILSSKDDWDNPDGWIKITPIITSLAYSHLIENISEKIPDETLDEHEENDEETCDLENGGLLSPTNTDSSSFEE